MKKTDCDRLPKMTDPRHEKHPKCEGWYDEFRGDYDCGYATKLTCEECKYGVGRNDPEAKCNAA